MGPFATLAAEMPLHKVTDVKQIEPGTRPATRRPTPDETVTIPHRGRGAPATSPRFGARWSGATCRPGRRPSFEVSQLEIEADIQQVIARVEAARSQARDAEALKLKADRGTWPRPRCRA